MKIVKKDEPQKYIVCGVVMREESLKQLQKAYAYVLANPQIEILRTCDVQSILVPLLKNAASNQGFRDTICNDEMFRGLGKMLASGKSEIDCKIEDSMPSYWLEQEGFKPTKGWSPEQAVTWWLVNRASNDLFTIDMLDHAKKTLLEWYENEPL